MTYREGDRRHEEEHEEHRDGHRHSGRQRQLRGVGLGLLDVGHHRRDVWLGLGSIRLGLQRTDPCQSLPISPRRARTVRGAAAPARARKGVGVRGTHLGHDVLLERSDGLGHHRGVLATQSTDTRGTSDHRAWPQSRALVVARQSSNQHDAPHRIRHLLLLDTLERFHGVVIRGVDTGGDFGRHEAAGLCSDLEGVAELLLRRHRAMFECCLDRQCPSDSR